MERLIVLPGYKLPCEQVWVDANEMYEVYSFIEIDIDSQGPVKFIITGVEDNGLIVEVIQ